MNTEIYYEIRNNGKNEFVKTNNKIIQKYIEEAQKYYNLKVDMEANIFSVIKSFKTGDFVLYILSQNTDFDIESNIKINFIKQYLKECIKNEQYFKVPIFLAFIRDILQIPKFEFKTEYYSSNYYNDKDILEKINRKNIKTKLSAFSANKKSINVDKTYVCENIVMFILVSLFEIMNNNKNRSNKIHECINCGRLFINNSNDKNTKYCNYISPQNKRKTCFKYRETTKFQEIRKQNPIYHTHNKIYDFLNKRRKRAEEASNKENPYETDELVKKCQTDLDNFKYWYDKKTKEYKNGNLTKGQFIELLKEQGNKYKEEKKNGSSRTNKKQKI